MSEREDDPPFTDQRAPRTLVATLCVRTSKSEQVCGLKGKPHTGLYPDDPVVHTLKWWNLHYGGKISPSG